MIVKLETQNKICKTVKVECLLSEWLLIHKAMRVLYEDDYCHEAEVEKLKEMIDTEPEEVEL